MTSDFSTQSARSTEDKIDKCGKIIWGYMEYLQPVDKAECMIVLGSNDPRVASRAGELLLEGKTDYAVFTGAVGRGTAGLYGVSEAEYFANIALAMGVEPERVFIEPKATNTGDNFHFTFQLLSEQNLAPNSFLLVQKNYMCRRAYATFRAQNSHAPIGTAAPDLSYESYPTELIDRDRLLDIMVGDYQRMSLYAELGYQVPQEASVEVESAYLSLVELGYDSELVAR